MIKLKNGYEIEYTEDFDLFFRNLLESIITQSKDSAEKSYDYSGSQLPFNEVLLKEIMDNCIFVSHQLFEISKFNEEFSKFMITGFIFNSIIMSLSHSDDLKKNNDDDNIIH